MAQYIDKAAVVAQANIEITNYRLAAQQGFLTEFGKGKLEALEEIVDFLDTLEVKEVDLEKEAEKFVQTKEFAESKESPVLLIAKHFYELGLTQKGE